jgi:hypothetical protein
MGRDDLGSPKGIMLAVAISVTIWVAVAASNLLTNASQTQALCGRNLGCRQQTPGLKESITSIGPV